MGLHLFKNGVSYWALRALRLYVNVYLESVALVGCSGFQSEEGWSAGAVGRMCIGRMSDRVGVVSFGLLFACSVEEAGGQVIVLMVVVIIHVRGGDPSVNSRSVCECFRGIESFGNEHNVFRLEGSFSS